MVEYGIDLTSVVVGRAEGSPIVLDDLSVARRHARLSIDSGRLMVEDLGSATGTFIDGQRIEPNDPSLVEDGQELRFGEVALTFAAPAALPPEFSLGSGVATRGALSVDDAAAPDLPAAIRAALDGPVDAAQPGGSPVTATLTVYNRGQVVDGLDLAIAGLPAEWVELGDSSLILLPDGSATVPLSFNPPRVQDAEAGIYDFSVVITSRETGRELVVPGQLTVLPFASTAFTLRPIRGKRDFELIAENRGNRPMSYDLGGADDEEAFIYRFDAPSIDIPPGAQRSLPFRVLRKKRPLFGPKTIAPFAVTGSVDDEPAQPIATGQLVIRPPLQPLQRPAMFAFAAAMAIVLVLLAVVVLPDGILGGKGGVATANAEAPFDGVHMCDKSSAAAQQAKQAQDQAAAQQGPVQSAAAGPGSGGPYFMQNDPAWGADEYAKARDPEFGPDWCGVSVAQCGCAMTSVTNMMALFQILVMPDGRPLTPQTVNEWFNLNARKTSRGWVSQGYIYGDVIWTAANQLSGEIAQKYPGTRTVRFARTGTGSDEEVREQLKLGRPILIEVPGHWIAAVGLEGDKILIADPFYKDRTTLDAYKGKIKSSVIFEPSEDLSAVVISAPSSVRVRVTDKEGRVVGTLNTGSRDEAAKVAQTDIPGASYSARAAWRDPTCVASAPPPDAGTNQIFLPGKREDYKIEVLDTSGGATSVAIHTYNSAGTPSVRTLDNPGSLVAQLAYDPSAKAPDIKVLVGVQPTPDPKATPSASPSAGSATPAPTQGGGANGAKPGETTLSVSVPAGATKLEVASNLGFALGDVIRISPGAANQEDNVITGFGSFLLAEPLRFAHGAGEPIIRLGAPANPTGSATPPPAQGPPPTAEFVAPDSVALSCGTTVTDQPKLATLICTAKITGDYSTTRWTLNGVVQGLFTGQTALFTSFTKDTSTAIAITACNRTACKSTATTEQVRFAVTAAPEVTPTVAPTPTPVPIPESGITVTCQTTFEQNPSRVEFRCKVLSKISFSTVSWVLKNKNTILATPTLNSSEYDFTLTSAVPDSDGFAKIELTANGCNGSDCQLSPPQVFPIPVASVVMTVVPSEPVPLNSTVNLFAVVTGGVAPAGGAVTFFDESTTCSDPPPAHPCPIGLDVTITELKGFGVANLVIPTGNFPLSTVGLHNIRAKYNGGKNILQSGFSPVVPLTLLKAVDDLCDSVDNNLDQIIDDQCEFPGHGGLPNTRNVGAGTILTDIDIDPSGTTSTSRLIDLAAGPAGALTVSASATVSPQAGEVDFCPECLRQVYFGVGSNAANNPVTPQKGPVCVGFVVPKDAAFSISSIPIPDGIPSTPGRYYVRATSSLQPECGTPPVGDPGTTIGRFVVKGETSVTLCPAERPCGSSSIYIGGEITLTALVTVAAPGSGMANGQLQFKDTQTGRVYGPVPVVNGVAVFTQNPADLGPLSDNSPVGIHTFRAEFLDGTNPADPEGISYYHGFDTATCENEPEPGGQTCSVDITVLPSNTTLSLTSAFAGVQLGQSLTGCDQPDCTTLQAVIPAGSSDPTHPGYFGPHEGFVQFWDGSALLGTVPVVSQAASLDLLSRPVYGPLASGGAQVTGLRDLFARYCPDIVGGDCVEKGNYRSTAAAPPPGAPERLSLTVDPQPTGLALTGPSNAKLGAAGATTITATISPGSYGAWKGTVDFTVEGQVFSAPVVGGVAQLSLDLSSGLSAAGLNAGPHAIAAIWNTPPVTNYRGSATTGSLTVTAATTVVTLDAIPSPITVGAPTTFTARLGLAAGVTCATAPACFGGITGVVEFRRGYVDEANPGTLVGSVTPGATDGVAVLALDATQSATQLPAGPAAYDITVRYVPPASGNYAPGVSAPRSLKVDPSATTIVVQACKDDGAPTCTSTVNLGDPVKLTALIVPSIPGARPFSGTVTFKNELNQTIATATVVPIIGGGIAVANLLAPPSTLAPGTTHQVSATYSGAEDYAASATTVPSPLTVNQAPTATALTLAPATIALGQDLTLIAAVSVADPNILPGLFGPFGGEVQFLIGTQVIATDTTISDGQASVTVQVAPSLTSPPLGVGTYNVTARYCPTGLDAACAGTPTGNYAPSTSAASTLTVTKPAPTVTVSFPGSSPAGHVKLGSNVSVSAQLSTPIAGVGSYAGTVSFYRGSVNVANLLAGGSGIAVNAATNQANTTVTATFANFPGAGEYDIIAVFSGDPAYADVTSAPVRLTVDAFQPVVTLNAPTTPITVGTAVTLTAGLGANTYGDFSGTVEFRRDFVDAGNAGTLLGTAVPGATTGTATLSLTASESATLLPAGATYTITAHFLGITNYAPGISAGRNLTVNQAPTTTTVQACLAPSGGPCDTSVTLGDQVNLIAVIIPSSGGTAIAGARAWSGTVTFTESVNGSFSVQAQVVPNVLGGLAIATVAADTDSATTLGTGAHTITATFSGAGDYAGSVSVTSAPLTVAQLPTTVSLTAAPNPVALGDALTLTASLSPGGFGPYGGTVDFLAQQGAGAPIALGTAAPTNGQASITFDSNTKLSVGTYNVTARYCPPGGGACPSATPTGNYATGVSAATVLVVSKPQPTVTVTFSGSTPAGHVALGSTVTLNADFSAAGYGAYTGTVNFYRDQVNPGRLLGPGVFSGGTSSLLVTANGASFPSGAGDYDIIAVLTGDPIYADATSAPVRLTVDPFTPTVTLDAPTSPITVGTGVTLTARLGANTYGNFSGNVEFRRGYVNAGNPGVLLGSASVGANSGDASLTLSASQSATLLPAGATYSISAHFLGGNNYAPAASTGKSLTVNQAPTTTIGQACAVVNGQCSGSGPVSVGEQIKLVAVIIPTAGGTAIAGARPWTGTVTFTDSANPSFSVTAEVLPNALGGLASYIVDTGANSATTLGAGTHQITATFNGGDDYAASADTTPAAIDVNKLTTTIALSMGPNPVTSAGSVTFTATLSANGSAAYTGNVVEFRDDYVSEASPGTLLGAATSVTNSQAVQTVSAAGLTAGTHLITARFLGDANHMPSVSSPASSLTVLQDVAITAAASPNPVALGSSSTLTVTFPAVGALGAYDATGGAVTFWEGPTQVGGAATFSGGTQATLSVDADANAGGNNLGPGLHAIVAKYSGNGAYAPAQSAAFVVTISAAPTTLMMTANGSSTPSVLIGDVINLSAALSGGGTATTGLFNAGSATVTFYANGVALAGAVTLNPGTANATTATQSVTSSLSLLPAGTYSLTAVYSGNAQHAAQTSAPITLTVTKGSTVATTAFGTGTTSPFLVGPDATFRVTLTSSTGFIPESGTVVLYQSASGTGGWNAIDVSNTQVSAGVYDFSVPTSSGSSLGVGTHFLMAVYLGNSNFNGSTNPGTNLGPLIVQQPTTTTLSFSPASPPRTGPITITATISPTSAGSLASCTVTFAEVVSGTPTDFTQTVAFTAPGTFDLTLPANFYSTAGPRDIRATFAACANYGGSIANATLTVT